MKTTLPTPTTLRRRRTFLANSIRALLFSAAAATSLLAATFDSPIATWTRTPTYTGTADFDASESPTFSTLSGVTGLTVSGTSGGYGHEHTGLTTLTIELFDPNTATWNSVHSVPVDESAKFFYDGLSITFASQTASQIRLFSNSFQDQAFHDWGDEIFTLIYSTVPAAPTVPLTLHRVDVGAIFSTLESGLPLAVAQRNLLLNALRTATRDVNGRLFALRAGLSLTEDAAGSAGPKGNDLMHRNGCGGTKPKSSSFAGPCSKH